MLGRCRLRIPQPLAIRRLPHASEATIDPLAAHAWSPTRGRHGAGSSRRSGRGLRWSRRASPCSAPHTRCLRRGVGCGARPRPAAGRRAVPHAGSGDRDRPADDPSGGHSGWHTHSGPVVLIVKQGTLTNYVSGPRGGKRTRQTAGEPFSSRRTRRTSRATRASAPLSSTPSSTTRRAVSRRTTRGGRPPAAGDRLGVVAGLAFAGVRSA